VTKGTYRKLKVVWLLGSAIGLAAITAGWLKMLPFGAVFAVVLVFGGAAAFAGWARRDQNFEELPE
jgi:hypothetical protein